MSEEKTIRLEVTRRLADSISRVQNGIIETYFWAVGLKITVSRVVRAKREESGGAFAARVCEQAA